MKKRDKSPSFLPEMSELSHAGHIRSVSETPNIFHDLKYHKKSTSRSPRRVAYSIKNQNKIFSKYRMHCSVDGDVNPGDIGTSIHSRLSNYNTNLNAHDYWQSRATEQEEKRQQKTIDGVYRNVSKHNMFRRVRTRLPKFLKALELN